MNDNLSLVYEKVHIDNKGFPATFSLREKTSESIGSKFHWHEAIEIYYVLEGALTLNTNGEFYRLNKGDLGIVGWGLPHRGFDFDNVTKHYIIQVDISAIPQLENYTELQVSMPLANVAIKDNTTATSLLDCAISAYNTNEKASELDSLAALLKFFAIVLRENDKTPASAAGISQDSLKHIHEMLYYMNNHFREPITLDELSQNLGLSKAYMCRLFKKHVGQTIIHYLNEQRCYYALSLIKSGVSLQEAALTSGFTDYNYFSRVFKQVMGRRPSNDK